jgi:catechol 2,3-dioxygenase-like lactoylglutathione lyase family enzyme
MMTLVRHIGIVVSDLDRSLAFYRDLLGLEIVRQMDERGPFLDAILGMNGAKVRTVKLAAPGDSVQIELLAFTEPAPQIGGAPNLTRVGPTHVAFTVDDLDGLHQRLAAAGTRFTTKPQTSPDGRAKVTFCHDPDGTALELVEVLVR